MYATPMYVWYLWQPEGGDRSPGNWTYRWLWATRCNCWKQNPGPLQEQQCCWPLKHLSSHWENESDWSLAPFSRMEWTWRSQFGTFFFFFAMLRDTKIIFKMPNLSDDIKKKSILSLVRNQSRPLPKMRDCEWGWGSFHSMSFCCGILL